MIFKRFGWGVAALITPITLLTTGIAFFSLTMFPAFFAPVTARYECCHALHALPLSVTLWQHCAA